MSITSVLFFPIFVVLTIGFSLAAILAALVDPGGNRAHRVGAAWATCLLFFSGVRARITYLEPLAPAEAYIFAANHQSAFDILALLSRLKIQFRWLAKESLFKTPFMGWAMSRVGYIPINRSNPKSAYRSLLQAAKKVENGTSVLIFPEGTRQEPNQLGDFKKGGFILAVKSGRPMVPVSISGSAAVLPEKELLHQTRVDNHRGRKTDPHEGDFGQSGGTADGAGPGSHPTTLPPGPTGSPLMTSVLQIPDFEPAVEIIPLGGLGEIGLNMLLFKYGEEILVIDAGLMFPEDYMLGIDIAIPDFSYLLRHKDQVRAVVLTHGHEDHIGALPFLLRELSVPVYGSRFTLELLREKLKEHQLLGQTDLRLIAPKETLELGSFKIEFIRVAHSIPDGLGLAIQTPLGTFIHSGDFKIDQTGGISDINTLAAYGDRGVLALLSDSTNVEREGYTVPEKRIGESLDQIMRKCEGRVMVAVFASNIYRIQQVVNSAVRYGRQVAFNGKSMITNCRIARELGYLHLPPGREITLGEMAQTPDSQVAVITTGSQAEPMSSLTRIARDDHKQIKIKKGDTVILSSRFIPGNERAITGMIDNLYRFGAEVIYERVSEIHVSGHAHQEELKLMLRLTKPRYFLPIHGEYRHLVKHAQLAHEIGLPWENLLLAENGQVIRFDREGCRFSDPVEVGRVFVDGKGVGDVGDLILRDRRHLSNEGLVVVLTVLNNQNGDLLSGPEIISRGFISEEEYPELIQEAKNRVLEILTQGPVEDRKNWPEIQKEIRKALQRFFVKSIDRRPVVLPLLIPM